LIAIVRRIVALVLRTPRLQHNAATLCKTSKQKAATLVGNAVSPCC
jgi:hypothetical protein